ncbi:MAG: DUF1573 domain-containing protein, partial [Acidobacteriota bacterium]|nr:DUF1573 domain-containing protein [Acidobacteriota bacterium]
MRIILFLSVCLLLFGSTILAQNPPQTAHPRAVPIDPNSDAGTFAKGDKISHDFLIRNEGNAPLLVTEARPSCGCTVADFDRTVSPGKVGQVRV